MKYNSINTCECTNGLGWGISLFTQGCDRHCEGCFNPETWNFNDGKVFTQEQLDLIIDLLHSEYITRFSFLGGEPLAPTNRYQVACIINKIHSIYDNTRSIWIWSGYTYEELKEQSQIDNYLKYILNNADILIDGPFIKGKKDLTLKWRGSNNQRIIDLKATNKENKLILLK